MRKARSIIATILVALALLVSCSGLATLPFVGSSEESAEVGAVAEVTNNLWRFGWLSAILVLLLPQVREPLVVLWSAIFRALAVPFLAIRQWFDDRSTRS